MRSRRNLGDATAGPLGYNRAEGAAHGHGTHPHEGRVGGRSTTSSAGGCADVRSACPTMTAMSERSGRRRAAALAGHGDGGASIRAFLDDGDSGVRATALRGLRRRGTLTIVDVAHAADDDSAEVRRAAAEVVAQGPDSVEAERDALAVVLEGLLADADPSVVEVAAWATGEWVGAIIESEDELPSVDLVPTLVAVTAEHPDALCREAAVAALGAIGDPAALPVILAATRDKATVRRRAVIALAPFEGDDVDEALERALGDRDWQVRQAAEDLLADPDEDDDHDVHDDEGEPRG